MELRYPKKYYLIESGEFFIDSQNYAKLYADSVMILIEYVKLLGGIGYITDIDQELTKIAFKEGEIPKGFTKPDRRGYSRPYKRSKYVDEFKLYSLPTPGKTGFMDDIKCPSIINYTHPGGSSSECMTLWEPIGLYWFNGEISFMITLPDVEYYVKKALKEEPEATFPDGIDKWSFDFGEGVKEILLEEWQLMVAKYEQSKKELT